jgi:hypothetical protein
MAILTRESLELNIKDTTVDTHVGDEFYIKLKYYLNCCNSFVDIPDEFTDYKKTAYCPSVMKLIELRDLCFKYSLKNMENDKHFVKLESIEDAGNRFFTISASTNLEAIGLSEDFFVGISNSANSSRVLMFFKESWARKFFYKPLADLNSYLNSKCGYIFSENGYVYSLKESDGSFSLKFYDGKNIEMGHHPLYLFTFILTLCYGAVGVISLILAIIIVSYFYPLGILSPALFFISGIIGIICVIHIIMLWFI